MKELELIIVDQYARKPGDPHLWEIEVPEGAATLTTWSDFPFKKDGVYKVKILEQNEEDRKNSSFRMAKIGTPELVRIQGEEPITTDKEEKEEEEDPLVQAIDDEIGEFPKLDEEPPKQKSGQFAGAKFKTLEFKKSPEPEKQSKLSEEEFQDAVSAAPKKNFDSVIAKEAPSKLAKPDKTEKKEIDESALIPFDTQFLTLEQQQIQFQIKWDLFKWIQKSVLVKGDWQVSGKIRFLKKSGFRKFAQAFRLKLKIVDKKLIRFDEPLIIRAKQDYFKWVNGQKIIDVEKGTKIELDWQYEVTCRVMVSDGTFAEQTGIVGSWHNNSYPSPHDALGTATTRAYSRAIADLVGYGVYSAEDL